MENYIFSSDGRTCSLVMDLPAFTILPEIIYCNMKTGDLLKHKVHVYCVL